MRIIGGEAGGRTIISPKGSKVRPTPEMVREALFNILKSLNGTIFLDLFAGTGSVGLEALSRGAERVVFIEKNTKLAYQIVRTVNELGYSARADVLAMDIKQGISRLSKSHEKFDIAFADPPYERDMISKIVQYCQDNELMADGGLIVLQHSRRESLCLLPQHDAITLMQERRYGDTMISFLRFHNKEH
jgi:16S rRNA (guanine966-N2)-methyltransferase